MSLNQPNLTPEEIQLLKELEIDPNSANLKTEIEDILDQNPVKYTNYDTGGISKALNWQGGGDFVYFEMAKNNITYLEKIEGLGGGLDSWKLFEELAISMWISYRVDVNKFKENKDQFLALDLEDQKKVLRDIINYNHLYVNYGDMNDEAYVNCGLSKQDKA